MEGRVEEFFDKVERLVGRRPPEFQLHALEEAVEGTIGAAVLATARNEMHDKGDPGEVLECMRKAKDRLLAICGQSKRVALSSKYRELISMSQGTQSPQEHMVRWNLAVSELRKLGLELERHAEPLLESLLIDSFGPEIKEELLKDAECKDIWELQQKARRIGDAIKAVRPSAGGKKLGSWAVGAEEVQEEAEAVTRVAVQRTGTLPVAAGICRKCGKAKAEHEGGFYCAAEHLKDEVCVHYQLFQRPACLKEDGTCKERGEARRNGR